MEIVYCSQCGQANGPAVRFCQQCGTALAERPAPTERSDAASPPTRKGAVPPGGTAGRSDEPTRPVQRPGADPHDTAPTRPLQRPGAVPADTAPTRPLQRPGAAPVDTAPTRPLQRPGAAPQDLAAARPPQQPGAAARDPAPARHPQQPGAPPRDDAHARRLPPLPAGDAQKVGQMGGGGMAALDIWGPFAGYGTRGRHVSWLLDNLGERAEALHDAVARRFRQREIPRAKVEARVLTGRGIAVERRPYYLVRRGVATAGLYIARFGQDLYISQVTYSKGPINPLRVLILVGMIVFQIYATFGYSDSVTSALGSFGLLSGYSPDTQSLGLLLCCVGPLAVLNTLALGFVGLHMAYKFVTDKDPFMILRTPPNEFQYDDIVALEKAVEETVRQSLDAIGIDAALMPPAAEYGVRQRLI